MQSSPRFLSYRFLLLATLFLSCPPTTFAITYCDIKANAANPECAEKTCCSNMGGIHYCDSSAGRYVCGNGGYSSCYCTRHAVMDIQKISGCCVWQGGVLTTDPTGIVICNNGGASEICSLQSPPQPVASW